MNKTWTRGSTRRQAMAAGLASVAAASALTKVRTIAAAPAAFHSVGSGGGAAGGGIVSTDAGDAQFLFFGTRFDVEDHDETLLLGNFQWLGADGTRIESVEITNYGPIEGDPEEDRELQGIATMNGEGRFAFTVRIVDGGRLGEGLDTLSLTVGPEGSGTPAATPEPIFAAEGTVTSGDIQLVNLVAEGV